MSTQLTMAGSRMRGITAVLLCYLRNGWFRGEDSCSQRPSGSLGKTGAQTGVSQRQKQGCGVVRSFTWLAFNHTDAHCCLDSL